MDALRVGSLPLAAPPEHKAESGPAAPSYKRDVAHEMLCGLLKDAFVDERQRGNAANALLDCVQAGHADFTHLSDEYLPGLLRARTFAVLEGHARSQADARALASGIGNLTLPHRLKDVAGYDPAALARELGAAIPHLAFLTIPAPKGQDAIVDLRGLNQRPPPRIHVLRSSTSVLTIQLRQGTPPPSSTAVQRESKGDPLALKASWCVWLDEHGAEVDRDKLAGVFHHPVALKSQDPVLNAVAQRFALETILNGVAQNADGSPIACHQLTMHTLHAWEDHDLRPADAKRDAADGHPSLQGLRSAEEIALTVSPDTLGEGHAVFENGTGRLFADATFGKTLQKLFAQMRPGQKRYLAVSITGPGSVGHMLPLRLRIKGDPLKYVVRLGEPNQHLSWGRGFVFDPKDLAQLTLSDLIRPEWLADYAGSGIPIGAMADLDARAVRPPAAGEDDDVPLGDRTRPEYLAAAIRCKKLDKVRSCVQGMLARDDRTLDALAAPFTRGAALHHISHMGDEALLTAYLEPLLTSPDLGGMAKLRLLDAREFSGKSLTPLFVAIATGQSKLVKEFLRLIRPLGSDVAHEALAPWTDVTDHLIPMLRGICEVGPFNPDHPNLLNNIKGLQTFVQEILSWTEKPESQRIELCGPGKVYVRQMAAGRLAPAVAAACAVVEAFPSGPVRERWLANLGVSDIFFRVPRPSDLSKLLDESLARGEPRAATAGLEAARDSKQGAVALEEGLPQPLKANAGNCIPELDDRRLSRVFAIEEGLRPQIVVLGNGGVQSRAAVVAKSGRKVTLEFRLEDDPAGRALPGAQRKGVVRRIVDLDQRELNFAIDFARGDGRAFAAYQAAGGAVG